MCQVFSHTWRLAYSILGKMMKARGKFAVLIPVLVLSHGCAVLAVQINKLGIHLRLAFSLNAWRRLAKAHDRESGMASSSSYA